MGQGHRLPCPILDRTRGHRALANDCSLALMFGTPSVLCQFCLLNLQVVLDERTTQPGYCCVLVRLLAGVGITWGRVLLAHAGAPRPLTGNLGRVSSTRAWLK